MKRKERIVRALGKRIAVLRKERNMTQMELSGNLDIDVMHLHRIERGKRYASLQLLCALTLELDVTLSELFDGIE